MQLPVMTPKQKKISDQLVRRGKVFHLMTSIQREFFEYVDNAASKTQALYCSRKIGKSYASLLYAFALCIRHPGLVVRYVLSSFKQAKDVVYPIADELFDVVPRDCYPLLRRSEATFVFANGSKIICSGANKDAIEGNRGPRCDYIFCDEICSWDEDNYDYLLKGVLFPQLTTSSHKRVIMCGTTSKNPIHPWFVQEYGPLKASGNLMSFTIYQNPLLSPSDIEDILTLYNNNPQHPEFLREYCCILSTALDLKIIPMFTKEKFVVGGELLEYLTDCTGNVSRWQGIIAGDLGDSDLTSVIGILVNTFTGKAIVAFERALQGNSLGEFAALYNELYEEMLPYCTNIISIVDTWEQCRTTLRKDHDLVFQRPMKRSVEDNVMVTRDFFEKERIIILEKCTYLIKQLEYGMWDPNKTVTKEFLRSKDKILGHLDHIAALIYAMRRVVFNTTNKDLKIGRTN